MAGDFNDLKIKSILDISPNLKQVVTQPTRFNPPAILDKIITSPHNFYQVPEIQPPLDNDPDKNGKPSDHRIVMMTPISNVNNKPARTNQKVTYRPLSEAGMQQMQEWLQQVDWDKETHNKNTHESASHITNTLRKKTQEFFPTKTRNILSVNQLFFQKN